MEAKNERGLPGDKENCPVILLDTSVLYAYLIEDDAHHLQVQSALGAIEPYQPYVLITNIALLEVMGKLVRGGISVNKASKLLLTKLKKFDTRFEQVALDYVSIIQKYKLFAKTNLLKLKGPDFYIAAEAMVLDGLLLTADAEIKEKAKSKRDQVFLITKDSSGEVARLIKVVAKIAKRTKIV